MKYGRTFFVLILAVTLSGCSGFDRWFASFKATQFAGDWIVVQYRFDGVPFNCWKLRDTSISNESYSDGIYWKDSGSPHLVHISGWYNRVQVIGGQYETAATLIGVDLTQCGNGKYPMK